MSYNDFTQDHIDFAVRFGYTRYTSEQIHAAAAEVREADAALLAALTAVHGWITASSEPAAVRCPVPDLPAVARLLELRAKANCYGGCTPTWNRAGHAESFPVASWLAGAKTCRGWAARLQAALDKAQAAARKMPDAPRKYVLV